MAVGSEAPNAFATGRNPEHGAVAVTTGMMRLLYGDALAGGLAHELGHIKIRDMLISVVAATVAGTITILANIAQWALLFGGGTIAHRCSTHPPIEHRIARLERLALGHGT